MFSAHADADNLQAYDYIKAPAESPIVRPYLEVFAFDTYGLGTLFTWSSAGNANLTLESRVGISFISREKACEYVADELPEGVSFEKTIDDAREAWEVGCTYGISKKLALNVFLFIIERDSHLDHRPRRPCGDEHHSTHNVLHGAIWNRNNAQ